SRFTSCATLRIRARSATDVPPNFMTILAICGWRVRVLRAIHRRRNRPAQPAFRWKVGETLMGDAAKLAQAVSVDDAEMAKFARMAAEWWAPNGKFRPLHRFNPVRLQFIRDLAAERFKRDVRAVVPFEGLTLLDIGCGGGLLSEPMARLGFDVL